MRELKKAMNNDRLQYIATPSPRPLPKGEGEVIWLFLLVCVLFFAPIYNTFASGAASNYPIIREKISSDYARITFEWKSPNNFIANAKGKVITINFDRKAKVNLNGIASKLAPYIVIAKVKSDSGAIILTMNKTYKIRTFIKGNISGVDFLGISRVTHEASQNNPEIKKNRLPHSLTLARNDETLAANLAKLAPAAGKPTPPPIEKPAIELDDGAAPTAIVSPTTQINKVGVSMADDSATLRFPLAQRTAFAVFIRNHYLWVVLGKPIKLDLSDFNDLAKTVIGKPEIIENSKATILYMPINDNIYASLKKEDNSDHIAILLTQKKPELVSPINIEISTAPPAPPNVLIPSLEMAEPIIVRDPVIGDSLIITPVFKLGEGVQNARDFIEFSLLESSQGIAVAKKADDVVAMQLRNGLRITTSKGADISPNLPKLEAKSANSSLQASQTLYPYNMWKLDDKEPRYKQLQRFFHEIVEAKDQQDANNARLKLAQIYLGDGLAPDALALIDGINRTNPSFYRTAKIAALRGAANFLMARYVEAGRDFAASELNNNKEMEYWRAVLSDLLGNTGQTYDYLAMNEDYISKYPPIFRQKLAIISADRAIDAKEYNVAIKIFDTIHQDNLLDYISVYKNFLMAKISASTGQVEEASKTLDKIADDYNHPFVRARAEFTRIAHDIDANGNKDKIIDRLERLRLNWHGDGLELKMLTLLGELYYERKDYINAMRVWNNGVQSFKNTASALDMARRMEEVFIVIFNDGIADKLPPLEALALYYEYRNYMPSGTAGNEMTERLADRLVGVDLLDQASDLLDRQMRTQLEKEPRSKIGAKLAGIYLLNHKPDKALITLQDSVYGENQSLLRLQRNRIAAEAMVDLGKLDIAMQTLGDDNSLDTDKIRIRIYWQQKDWSKLAARIENLLKLRPDITAPMSLDESEYLIKLALAYVFQDNKVQLQYLRDYFTPLMKDNPNAQVFDFITSKDISINSRNFDEVLKSVENTDTFIKNYKAKIASTTAP